MTFRVLSTTLLSTTLMAAPSTGVDNIDDVWTDKFVLDENGQNC